MSHALPVVAGTVTAETRIQIVTIEQALELRDRAVRLPARRDDGFKRAAREDDVRSQGALDL